MKAFRRISTTSLFVLALGTACGGKLSEDSSSDGGGEGASGGDSSSSGGNSSTGGTTNASGGESASGGEDAGGAGLGGTTSHPCSAEAARFATGVVSHQFGSGQNHNQNTGFPDALFGSPEANDTASVVSLGNGGWVVLEFAGNAIVDGPGVDFIVFENPLPGFAELGTVAVSDDLVSWTSFPCEAAQNADDYGQCAGVERVRSSSKNDIDPLDPDVAGGDTFDLASVGVTRARYVRVTDRVDLGGVAGVFDLDAVGIVHAECSE